MSLISPTFIVWLSCSLWEKAVTNNENESVPTKCRLQEGNATVYQ